MMMMMICRSDNVFIFHKDNIIKPIRIQNVCIDIGLAIKYEFSFSDWFFLQANAIVCYWKRRWYIHVCICYFKYICILFIAAQFIEFDLDDSGDIGMIWHVFIILSINVSFCVGLECHDLKIMQMCTVQEIQKKTFSVCFLLQYTISNA